MTNPSPAVPPPVIPDDLDRFIFNPDQFLKDDVPRDIDPLQIELLVRLKINFLTPFRALEQLFKVADYYDTYEIAPHLLKLLTKNEKTQDDFRRTAIIARIVALVGLPEEVNQAKDYYDYLVGKAEAYVALERVVALYEILSLIADPQPLVAKLDAKVAALAREQTKSDEARADYNAMERLRNFTLARAIKANDIKKKILAIGDRPTRINEEIKTYLTMQYGYGEYLPIFAARRLKHEAWAEQPGEQLKRTVDVKLRPQLANAFRNMLPAIQKLNLTDGEKEFMTVAVYDAIMFFRSTITVEEMKVLNGSGAKQKDILCIRKFH